MSYYILGKTDVGATDVSAGPPRLEIRDLRNQKEQFALFVHALATIMNPDHRPKAARFADIAGIHGKPYDGLVTSMKDSSPLPQEALEVTATMDQSIGGVAKRLATDWTRNSDSATKTKWNDAAKDLRFPFWDWTDKRGITSGVPEVLHPQRFTLELPGPIQVQIDNPLAFYDFRARHPDGFENVITKTPMASQAISYFKDWDRTYRWPSNKKNPTDDYIKMKEKLAGKLEERGSVLLLRDQVSKLFTYPATVKETAKENETAEQKAKREERDRSREATTWDEFSNTSFQSIRDSGSPRHGCGPLEMPHNTMHLLLGGNGNMSYGDYAGFDPIFHLHHCNIDRILAFWEYVYPQYWMGDGYKKKDGTPGTFTQARGTWAADEDKRLTQTTHLEPFRKKAAEVDYWTSNDARLKQILPLYTYPDINGVKLTTTTPTDTERDNYIKKLQTHFSNSGSSESAIHMSDLLKNFTLQNDTTVPQGFKFISGYRRFVVEVALAFDAFHGSYYLQLVYRGQVIGLSAVFSRGDDTQCAACIGRNKAGLQVHGIIDIPEDVVVDIIAQALGGSPSVGNIIDSLRQNLSVRIVGPGDTLLAVADLVVRDTAGLDSNILPKLRLLSAAGITKDQPDSPVQFFDWTDHGNFLGDSVKWGVA